MTSDEVNLSVWLAGNGHHYSFSPVPEGRAEDLESGSPLLIKDGLFGIVSLLAHNRDFFKGKSFVTSGQVYSLLPEDLRAQSTFYFYEAKAREKHSRDLVVLDLHTKIDGELGFIQDLSSYDFGPSPLVHLSICGGPTPYLAPIYNKINAIFDRPKLISQMDFEAMPDMSDYQCLVIKNPLLQSRSAYEMRVLEMNGSLDDSLSGEVEVLEKRSLSPKVNFGLARGGVYVETGIGERAFLSSFKRRLEKKDYESALNLLHAQVGKY